MSRNTDSRFLLVAKCVKPRLEAPDSWQPPLAAGTMLTWPPETVSSDRNAEGHTHANRFAAGRISRRNSSLLLVTSIPVYEAMPVTLRPGPGKRFNQALLDWPQYSMKDDRNGPGSTRGSHGCQLSQGENDFHALAYQFFGKYRKALVVTIRGSSLDRYVVIEDPTDSGSWRSRTRDHPRVSG